MKRYEMIKEKKYFNYIIKNGLYIKNKIFTIYYVKNNTNSTKFGIAIKNSIGNAVTRNRLKRQCRMIIDNNRKLFKLSEDYIIMIRNGCIDATYNEMNTSMKNLLKGRI